MRSPRSWTLFSAEAAAASTAFWALGIRHSQPIERKRHVFRLFRPFRPFSPSNLYPLLEVASAFTFLQMALASEFRELGFDVPFTPGRATPKATNLPRRSPSKLPATRPSLVEKSRILKSMMNTGH